MKGANLLLAIEAKDETELLVKLKSLVAFAKNSCQLRTIDGNQAIQLVTYDIIRLQDPTGTITKDVDLVKEANHIQKDIKILEAKP